MKSVVFQITGNHHHIKCHNIPEDSNLNTHAISTFKSHANKVCLIINLETKKHKLYQTTVTLILLAENKNFLLNITFLHKYTFLLILAKYKDL
jgi:hypothetical protein